jgi:hypothetical protein
MTSGEWTGLMTYPVEGDSAVYEISLRDQTVAEVWLDGINLKATGQERINGASLRIAAWGGAADPGLTAYSLIGQGTPEWEGELDGLFACLEDARRRLLENERGRLPL